jgi:hypothetical protein
MTIIYCYECGKKVSDKAERCPHCGAASRSDCGTKKGWAALLLAWFLGVFGAHRFYVGKTGSAIVMLILSITIVGVIVTGIWTLVDMITIICGKFTDAQGKKLKF